ncbi:hypothetical protein VP1G_01099 [Cytospora mali]|uniref:Uncharacterized protein n=1 Tax=Cytospora mali TaxID=578113 RepID=A0A194UQ77_CYTMA|nr:hypothetical protein VP1G_01099 [Valsa mali var. pyri (nom. inval.)]
MAAASVLAFAPCGTHFSPPSRFSTRTTGLVGNRESSHDDVLLNLRLSLIAGAWMSLRSERHPECFTTCQQRPIVVPEFCSPKWSRSQRKPSHPDGSFSPSLYDPTGTDSVAQPHGQRQEDPHIPQPDRSRDQRAPRSKSVADLLTDPSPDPIDFASDEGFLQAAGGKKKKRQATAFNWNDDSNGKKDGDGADGGGGGDGNKDQNGGDSGSGNNTGWNGGGNDGGKKDDDKKDDKKESDDVDDIWGDFANSGSKKSKSKTTAASGVPDTTSTDFHDIKLDDSGGKVSRGEGGADALDLGLGIRTGVLKTGLSAWTSGWWGGLGGSQTEASKPAEEEKPKDPPVDDNPWSIDRPKPKKKTTSNFTFGDLDEEGTKDSAEAGSSGSNKPAEKKDIGGFPWGDSNTNKPIDDAWGNMVSKKNDTPKEPEKLAGEASDDIWGWSSTKKERKDKGKPAILEEMPASAAGFSQVGQSSEERPEPEPALTPEEEAELRKLQTRKDVGSKMSKRMTDRYNYLTEKIEEAKLAAEAAAAEREAAEPPAESGDAVGPPSAGALHPANSRAGSSEALEAARAEAEEKARTIRKEEDEMAMLRSKRKLNRGERDRLRILEDRADERARESEEAAAASRRKEEEEAAQGVTESTDPAAEDAALAEPPADDAAQIAADEKARIIQDEEDEIAQLRSKAKLRRSEKDRLHELEDRAETRARKAEEAAEAAAIQAAQAEADEKARIILEEEEEMAYLKSKIKFKRSEKERLRELEDKFAARAREAEEAAAAAAAAEAAAEAAAAEAAAIQAAEAAEAEAKEKARIIQEEEEELSYLRSKIKFKRSEKERLRELEAKFEERAREAEEAAAAAAAAAAQAEADEKAKIIQEEEEEIAQLHAKGKLKKTDRERLQELEERSRSRAREAEEAMNPEGEGENGEPASDEKAPISVDDTGDDKQAEQDELARLIEEEEMELELLLSKTKYKRSEKIRLMELREKKELREQEAAAKAKARAEAEAEAVSKNGGDANDTQADENSPPDEDLSAAGSEQDELDDLAREIIEEEEQELELLLSKSKLRRAEKIRLQFLQENKQRREEEAASKAKDKNEPVPQSSGDVVDPSRKSSPARMPEDTPNEEPVDEVAAQKEAEDARIAAEEDELAGLLARYSLKKSERLRLKELQGRKDKRDEEAKLAAENAEQEERLAREKAEQEAKELEERQNREKEDRLRAKIAAEEAEISSLKSKRKLKTADRARLAELEARAQRRATAQAEKLAEQSRKEDAAKADQDKADAEPLKDLFWADDDASKDNGAGDDWMDWGLSSSKKSKKNAKDEPMPDPPAVEPEPERKSEESLFWTPWNIGKKEKKSKPSTLLDLGGSPDGLPAVPDAPPAIETDAFDFGWAKSSNKKDIDPVADDIWDFSGSSKKKTSKNTPVEVIEDPIKLNSGVQVKDKAGDNDFWSTFGSSKKDMKNSKEAIAAEQPEPTPSKSNLTETETNPVARNVLDDPISSTEFSATRSRSSDKDSKGLSKPEPKLSKKELEKLEKEKKKAEKEREKREAEEAAERARIEEEERLAAEAKAEEERLAREAEEQAQKEEKEKQGALRVIAQEEADLAALQARKDSGWKLTWREKDKYDKLSASCKARADEKAAQEAAEQAKREEEERLAREAEEQAQREAIEKEEAELNYLQRRKDAGRKFLQKEKDKYKTLLANKKARDKAAKEAEALETNPEPTELEKDLAKLNDNEINELDQLLSSSAKQTARAAEVNPFDFWGASKKLLGATIGMSPSVPVEIVHAESSKPVEATSSGSAAVENTTNKDKDVVVDDDARPALKDTHSSPSQPQPQSGSEPKHDLDIKNSNLPTSLPSPTFMRARKPVGGTIADRLKAFEATVPTHPTRTVDQIPPPPPPRPAAPEAPPVEDRKKKKSKSKSADIPGTFPAEEDERIPDENGISGYFDMAPPKSKKDKKSSKSKTENAIPMPPPPPPPPPHIPDDNDIVEVIDMAPSKSKKEKKSSRSKTENIIHMPPPPPPPTTAPGVPISPPPETEPKESKKDRAKINRDAGSSWNIWTSSTPKDAEEPRREHKSRSPEKEEKLPTPRSASDKAERLERAKEKVKEAPARPKLMNVFSSTPPISRTTSTREKHHREGRSSRRPSVDVTSGMVSPLSEPEIPTLSSKAAKILGVGDGLGRFRNKRRDSSRAEEDIIMGSANDAAEGPEKSSRRRPKQYPRDDGPVMVDTADVAPAPGLKRSNTSASAKKGFGGLFGGILSTPRAEPKPELRPEPQRQKTYHTTDVEDGGAMTDAELAARKAARRARKVEREAAGKTAESSRPSKDHGRREKRRKHDEDEEADRQMQREARRLERRAAKAREEEEERRAAEEKEAAREERRRQKHRERELEREREREAGVANGTTAVEDDEARRAARRERRKAEHGRRRDDDDEDRRRRRAERHAAREAEGKSSSRRRQQQVDDDFVYPRPSKVPRRHTDLPDKPPKKHDHQHPPGWPHSGTSSWVKDHSDAGPPPEDGTRPHEVVDNKIKGGDAGAAARREGKRRRKYGDGVVDVDVPVGDGGERRRRKRREERAGSGDGAEEKKKNVVVVDPVTQKNGGGGGGGWWKKWTGYG